MSKDWDWNGPKASPEENRERASKNQWPLYDGIDLPFDPAVAEEFCLRVKRGERVREICSAKHMPNCRDVYRWRVEQEEFRESWKKARKEGGINRFHHTHEQRLEVVEEILTDYAEGAVTLPEILETSPDYPRYGVLMRWKREIPEINEMWAQAEQARAMMMIEIAMRKADAADGDGDPRVLKLQIDIRKWLAERLYRAKYGSQQTIVSQNDELLNRTSEELEATLKGVLKEAQELGLDVVPH